MSGESGVLYCGTCGSMNPRTSHFCAACGHQLVDAYHPSEGLRIYTTPDPAAPLVEIVPAGSDLRVLETRETVPGDFVKIALGDGRIGYVRLNEVERSADDVEDRETRREPIGCVSSTAVLAVLGLLVIAATLVLVTAIRSRDGTADFISFLACLVVVPFLLLVVAFFLYVRKREDDLLAERAESEGQNEKMSPNGT